MDELKSICLEIGMSKKEFKAFDDEEEEIEKFFTEFKMEFLNLIEDEED